MKQKGIDPHLTANNPVIIACSALKGSYRKRLKQADARMIFVFHHGDFDLIWSRMRSRENHYMKRDILKSQFNTADETHIVHVNHSASENIFKAILDYLCLTIFRIPSSLFLFYLVSPYILMRGGNCHSPSDKLLMPTALIFD